MLDATLPTTYRAREVRHICAALSAGESCVLAGIGSVGKSNILRFLQQQAVLRSLIQLYPLFLEFLL